MPRVEPTDSSSKRQDPVLMRAWDLSRVQAARHENSLAICSDPRVSKSQRDSAAHRMSITWYFDSSHSLRVAFLLRGRTIPPPPQNLKTNWPILFFYLFQWPTRPLAELSSWGSVTTEGSLSGSGFFASLRMTIQLKCLGTSKKHDQTSL